MKCEDATKLLNQYMDGELSDKDIREFNEHIGQCKVCLNHVEFDRALRHVLKKKSLSEKISPEIKKILQKKLHDKS